MSTMTHNLTGATVIPGAPEPSAGVDLSKRAVYLKIDFHSFGNSRKITTSQIAIRKDQSSASIEGEDTRIAIDDKAKMSRFRASKRLLESKELAAINRHYGQTKKYIAGQCLPFDAGINLVPFVAVPTLDAKLAELSSEGDQLIEAFLAVYPQQCEEAAKDLNTQYNPLDYPTVDEMRHKFGMSWRYVTFGVPDQLKGISKEVWDQEREKAAKRMAEASAEIQQVLREAMAGLVEHMSQRLKEDEEGKPLTFHKTTVAKLTEFLSTFEFRNITDDTQLQAIVSKARELLDGVKTDDLKTLGDVRTRVKNGMADLSAQLDKLVVRAGGRKFQFDEE